MAGSANRVKLGNFCCFEVGEAETLVDLLLGAEDLNLPHVGVLAGVLVLQDDDLNIDSIDVVLLSVVEQLGLQGYCVPPAGLFQLQVLHFLQVLHVVSRADGNLGGGVGLIGLEIEEHAQFLHASLLHELDVDEMRLRPI